MMHAALVFEPNGPGKSLGNTLRAADPAFADRFLVKVVRLTFGQTGKGRTAASLAECWRYGAGNGAGMIILAFQAAAQVPTDQRPEMSANRLLKHQSIVGQGVVRKASV